MADLQSWLDRARQYAHDVRNAYSSGAQETSGLGNELAARQGMNDQAKIALQPTDSSAGPASDSPGSPGLPPMQSAGPASMQSYGPQSTMGKIGDTLGAVARNTGRFLYSPNAPQSAEDRVIAPEDWHIEDYGYKSPAAAPPNAWWKQNPGAKR